jgi:peptidyl-prolyl cis-trans isomerase D
MVNLMRKYQQTMLTLVTVIIIISFAWLYTDTRWGGRGGQDSVGTIYDHPIRLGEFQRGLRRMQLCTQLGMQPLVQALVGTPHSETEYQSNFVFNTYVLRHESDALGLIPTDEEVVEATKKMTIFQTNGAFDSSKYNMIVHNMGALGFDASTLEEVVRDDLRYQKLNALFSTTITASPSSARDIFEKRSQKTDVALVRLKEEDVAKTITVSDEDLKKAYDERKDGLKNDEKRKVKVASFVLSEEDKKLSGPAKAAVFQKLLDKANEFAVAMTQKDAKLDEVAKKMGVEIKETAEFAQSTPPAELGQSPEVAEAVFSKLTLEQPNSDAIQVPTGYYVVQLAGVTPARPLTFDEAKANLAESLKRERVSEAMNLKGTELRKKLEEGIKAGKTFAEAAQAAGATAETMPTFSTKEPPKPDFVGGMEIAQSSMNMAAGDLSEVLPVNGGSVIFRVEKRYPIDEADFEKEKPKLLEQLAQFEVRQTFPMWLAERRKAANLQSKIGG